MKALHALAGRLVHERAVTVAENMLNYYDEWGIAPTHHWLCGWFASLSAEQAEGVIQWDEWKDVMAEVEG